MLCFSISLYKWLHDNLITYCFSASLVLFTVWAAAFSCKWGRSPCWVDWQVSGPLLVLHSLCMYGLCGPVHPPLGSTSLAASQAAGPLRSSVFHHLSHLPWKASCPLAAAGKGHLFIHCSQSRILFFRPSFVGTGLVCFFSPFITPVPPQGHGPFLGMPSRVSWGLGGA